MPRPDPIALLCESCGYPIGELPREGNCPECGRAIEESLPERRAGTPWQQQRGAAHWTRTVAVMALTPKEVWRTVRVHAGSSWTLLFLNCALSGFGVGVVVAFWKLVNIEETGPWPWRRDLLETAYTIGLGGLGLTLVLFALSMIEYGGIRFFGARRRWRVSHGVAMAVVGHASVGWLLLPLTLPMCWGIAGAALVDALDGATGIEWLGTVVAILAGIAGPFIPLLAFELLVYEGVRRMRFANVEQENAPAGSSPQRGAGT